MAERATAWGNWQSFVENTQKLNPVVSAGAISALAGLATGLEILFAFLLLTPLKTPLVARLTGVLLLFFAIAMAINIHIKAPLDYSVFIASAAAFALSELVQIKNSRPDLKMP